MKGPCLQCPDRRPLCHAECERYREFRDNLDKNRRQYDEASDFVARQITRQKRKRGKK